MTDEIPANGSGERGVFYWHWDPETQTGSMREKPKKVVVEVNAPTVISDVCDVESWVDGKHYDSKSNLRRSYKQHGVIEKGNDRLPPPRQETDEERYADIREDVEKAFHDIKNDRVPLTELERERWNQEQRQMEQEKQRQKTRWAR